VQTEPLLGRSAGRAGVVDAVALFSVLWALAAVWHLLGNTGTAPLWAQGLLTVGVVAVLLRPGAPLPLGLLAVGGLVTMWEEAPLLGNHWLLAAFVDLAILLAVVTGIARRRPHDRVDLANRVLPPARLCLLGFYFFAGFAKLNSAFFDRSVSCATFFFRESTDSVGLRALQLDGAAWLEHAVIFGTAGTELLIPLLLVFQRTRRAGVVVGLVFHTVLAVDRSHEFFDFSSVLFALFVLFLPPMAGTWVGERVGSLRARLALRSEALPERVHLMLVAVPTTAGVLVAIDALTPTQARDVGWWPWQAFAVVVVAAAIRFLRQDRVRATVRLLPHHALFALVPLLVIANGLTPYLEVKTGYGWNMYANLRTVDGDTNHFVVPRTFPVTDEQADLVEIVATSSVPLRAYTNGGYALTWRQLRSYLARHPAISITYKRGNEIVALRRADDRPEAVQPVPAWREKVQLFRAVDLHEPERCVPAFGPAR
jgi:hypothetical protein